MALPIIFVPLILGSAMKGVDSIEKGVNNLTFSSALSKELEKKYKLNMKYFENKKSEVTEYLDNLGKKELEIFKSFEIFSEIMGQIQNKPVFKEYLKEDFIIPEYNPKEIEEVSLAASLILGGIGSASIGTLGGVATGGATTILVSALGTASTGTAINSLGGIAATKALYAALGGGSLITGGGGVAAGSVVLGGTTLGIGLLAGGLIFEKYTESIKDKIQEILKDVSKTTNEITKICNHLDKLKEVSIKFSGTLILTTRIYKTHLLNLYNIVFKLNKKDWYLFTNEEKLIVKNTILLVRLLYNLGKTRLLLIPENENKLEEVNEKEIEKLISNTKNTLVEKRLK